jgi:hypothetical protein
LKILEFFLVVPMEFQPVKPGLLTMEEAHLKPPAQGAGLGEDDGGEKFHCRRVRGKFSLRNFRVLTHPIGEKLPARQSKSSTFIGIFRQF